MFSTYEDKQGVMSAVPSLKSMSMVQVAVSICTGGALEEDIPTLSSLDREEQECMMKDKSRTAIETLYVPQVFLDPLADQTLLVAIGMRYWGQSLKGHFDLDAHYYASVLSSSMFLSNGQIDRVEVAKEVVRDQQLDVSKRFVIACFYWFEDSIVDFWGQMTVEQRQTVIDAGHWTDASRRRLAAKVACELAKGGGLVFSDRVVVRKVIECAAASGSEVVVRHLWSQLDPEEVEEIAEAMIRELPLGVGDDYRTDEFADILCFLLPELTEHRRRMFVFESECIDIDCHLSLFDMLVSTKRIHAIWDLMSTSMQHMHGSEFVTALHEISFTIRKPDTTRQRICCDDYRELLKKIWTQSPAHLKKYAITQTGDSYFWEKLLSHTEKTRDIIAFFLEDATHEEKLDMIFSKSGKNGLICQGFYGDDSVSNFLLRLLNLSQDEKRQLLKREILFHNPLTCGYYFVSAARYCLQFEDDDTKAEFKRKLVGDRIDEFCVRYILKGIWYLWWTDLDSLLCWYFSTTEEVQHFKTTLLETSGPDICQRVYYRRRSMQGCYAWFGLDPNEIRELQRRTLSALPGL